MQGGKGVYLKKALRMNDYIAYFRLHILDNL